MSMDLTGITNKNEYFTNHYFSTVFEDNANATISGWSAEARESEEIRTPWSLLRQNARQYYTAHDKFVRSSVNIQVLANIRTLADNYLKSLGYPEAKPEVITVDDGLSVPVYLEMTKSNGAPLLWVLLSASKETDAGIMESYVFNADDVDEDAAGALYKGVLGEMPNEDLVTKILFGSAEPPRFIMLIGMNQIALIDRNKWNEKRYLQFELEEIFSRLENTTLQAMAVLLHKDSLCPDDGKVLLDELDEQSQKNASGVSEDLKYALRESIELLGNEVLYDMKTRLGRDLEADPVDAGQLTLECLRYMYRMLFVLFIEARPELGYAPIKAQSYYSGYSLESLRDIADNIRDDVDEVGEGYYLHETLAKLYELIYGGYPKTEEELKKATGSDSLHDMFLIAPLKAHIFDPDYTRMITAAKLRNSCMLRIIDLMSLTRATGRRNGRRGRISYANLGINQMGAVYEALLSYRGFIAEHDLYEVKRAGDSFNELDVGYFVSESELDQYTEEERVRYESGEKKGKLRMYEKGTFIYRLAGREREKSASYYTPEVLTKCLVKYALKELLKDKTADEILHLTVCEPAMGSAAFLNEAINQLAEAYISKKEQETGEIIGYENRFKELQKVKMFIADRNVYGIDLNPVAVELAEVSLWLNTIYEGGFVPWFGTQLVNGNSLIGARRQVYSESALTTTSQGLRWYENAPERVPLGTERKKKKGYSQIYHFLLGDPGMCSYGDKVIKSLEPENIKRMKDWNKKFTAPYSADDLVTLQRLSDAIDELWKAQIDLRKEVGEKTQDSLSVFGYTDEAEDSHTTIRQKDKIFSELYKSEHMRNAGPYARLKFAMDYWCALWFWPIDQADLLPTRSEFLFDMSLILEGTMASVKVTDSVKGGQMTLFPTEMEQLALDIIDTYGTDTVVDIPRLRKENPRLDLAARIAEQNHFMHWELEFADLFAERGGFDLIIGNPPWIKITWNEQSVLSDRQPIFAVKKLSASETAKYRTETLEYADIRQLYFSEFEEMSGEQNFLNAIQNYADLKGQQTNLFKCFLPQAWMYNAKCGVSAFIHPEGVYDDPKGGALREKLYPRLRYHFQFANERKLFPEVDHHTQFSLNVYGGPLMVSFDTISNLYDAKSIVECYEGDASAPVPGIKDENGEWNTTGHPDRVIHVTKKELSVFAKLFDDSDDWKQAKLPVLHARQIVNVIECFLTTPQKIYALGENVITSLMWDETNAQKDGTIQRDVHFTNELNQVIYSGPHIGVCNPIFKCSRSECRLNSDYDNIDLMNIPEDYLQRINYLPGCSLDDYWKKVSETSSGEKITMHYRLILRKMLNITGERTLIGGIVPPFTAHTNGLIGIDVADIDTLLLLAGTFASVPFDFLIKITGKSNFTDETARMMPVLATQYPKKIIDVTLKTVCEFYGGDWAGIMDIDMDTCLWRPVCWFRAGGSTDRTLYRLSGLEDAEVMPRWLESMHSAMPIVLTDTTEIRESNPAEFALYERLDAKGILASPFSPAPTGFLVIRNPSRYLERPEALFIFAYVLHRALAQQNVMEREKIIEAMNPMEPTYDVYISFFRDLEIRTAGGTLTEQIINAPKTIQLIAYLLLKPERAHSPREIFEHLNPGEDFDGNTNAIRGSIYRFSNMYAKRTGQSARLIIREGSGYRRNPELKIMTDIEQFDLHMKAAEAASGSAERIEELRKAVELYKGQVFMFGRDQLWLNDIVSQYEVRYIKAADALMRELAKQKDYAGVMQYAARAHELFTGNGLICYWLIMATYSLSGADMAKKEYFRLKDDMTQEENDVVTEHLKKNSLIRYEELFGV